MSKSTPPDVKYHRVNPTIWSQPWTNDAKYLALYLLTCTHRTTEGLFRLPHLYVRADLDWTPERLDEAWGELLADGFIEWSAEQSVVLIVGALRVQSPANPNGVIAAVRQLALVPKSLLDARFGQLAQRYCERLWEGLPERFTEQSDEPSGEPPTTNTNTNTEEQVAPDGSDADPIHVSEDAVTLAKTLAELVKANGHPLPRKGSNAAEKWLVASDRLLRLGPPGDTDGLDPPTLGEATRVARWATSDPFWKANVQSMPKFRRQWPQLKLQSDRDCDGVSDFAGPVDVTRRTA